MPTSKFSSATGQILICMKNYHQKVCRKGMLERGIMVQKWFGDFKVLENDFLKKITMPNADINELVFNMKKQKVLQVNSEIERLKMETNNLWNTIINKKCEVQIQTDESSYLRWREAIEESSSNFKKLYSKEANELFDHLYKMDRIFEESILLIANHAMDVIENVCVPSDENRLAPMEKNEFVVEHDELMHSFINSSSGSVGSSKGDDSGFTSLDDSKTNEPNRKHDVSKKACKRRRSDVEVVDEIGTVEMSMSQIGKMIRKDDRK